MIYSSVFCDYPVAYKGVTKYIIIMLLVITKRLFIWLQVMTSHVSMLSRLSSVRGKYKMSEKYNLAAFRLQHA